MAFEPPTNLGGGFRPIGPGQTINAPITIGGIPISVGGGAPISIGGIGGAIGGAAGHALSSVLGIPSINWGRLAAFLLGLLLIAGGLYLLKPVQQIVIKPVTRGAKLAGKAIAESAAA